MRCFACVLLTSALAMGVVGCSGEHPATVAPTSMPDPPTVQSAQVLVSGLPIRGLVVEGTDEPSLFRVHVGAPGGLSAIDRVVLRYSQPGLNHHGGGPMMGGFRGTVVCYDDGTHGDNTPGDGIYHFMDPDEDIGCHGAEAPLGEYHYEFWCEDVFGQRSNVASVTVVRQ